MWFGPASAARAADAPASAPATGAAILKQDLLRRYVATFNRNDHTHFGQAISNEAAADWMAANVPLFECPDKDIEEIYHFRWWTFRKHIKETPDGFVITEFLPKVTWSGKAQHHQLRRRTPLPRRPLDPQSEVSRRLRRLLVPQGRRSAPLQLLGRRFHLSTGAGPRQLRLGPSTCCRT